MIERLSSGVRKTSASRLCVLALLVLNAGLALAADSFQLDRSRARLELPLDNGRLALTFLRADILRVTYVPEGHFRKSETGVCVERTCEKTPRVKLRQHRGQLELGTDSLLVCVNLRTGALAVDDARSGRRLMTEQERWLTCERVELQRSIFDEGAAHIISTADGQKTVNEATGHERAGQSWRFGLHLLWQPGEALYGLGSHMENYMNLRGHELFLCQHNLKAMVPVLQSTAGYALLIDAGCSMVFRDTDEGHGFTVEAAPQLDFYVLKGHRMDAAVAAYRWLTGDAPMMPRWLFGYTQSKERYTSSRELIKTLEEFRKRNIPVDCIVQDWNYWPDGQWGRMHMNPRYYPDKQALADSIHALHAQLMISIWPSMMGCPQAEDFRNRGWMLPGTSVYNAFEPAARDLYWDYARKEFFDNGFDAWWCDSTEPVDADWGAVEEGYGYDSHRRRWELCTARLAEAMGAERSQLFSLRHSQGIYEHQRAATSAKRVVNLTRSSYAGQQRYATITWNGDTYASWRSFAQMIPAGLNFMATGCPYWTIDVGAFFTRRGWQWFWCGEYEKGASDLAYRELYVRMLQYATFLPMLRSHGTDTPREPWQFGEPGTPFYDAILQAIRLRYRLLPYIYSAAAAVTAERSTMARPLAFDFPDDERVLDIADQYLFGPALMVAPVTEPARVRPVYLPRGCRWIDFWTGKLLEGGQMVQAEAPLEHIPVYVKAGAILALSGPMQYTSERLDEAWDIHVYPAADGTATVYEDDGDGYACEQGACSRFTLRWDDHHRCLHISARTGDFPGLCRKRTLHLRPLDMAEKTIVYDGTPQTIQF